MSPAQEIALQQLALDDAIQARAHVRQQKSPGKKKILPIRGHIQTIDLPAIQQSTIDNLVHRMAELTLAVVAFALLAPVMGFVAILVRVSSPGPVILRQIRLTQGKRRFTMYKFRTMYQDAEARTGAVLAQDNDPRITPIGRFLRKTRLDELPQLLNVIKGDMSIVGPRPERPELAKDIGNEVPKL